jgi:predicted nucleic acid-binding Zn ribbon protein
MKQKKPNCKRCDKPLTALLQRVFCTHKCRYLFELERRMAITAARQAAQPKKVCEQCGVTVLTGKQKKFCSIKCASWSYYEPLVFKKRGCLNAKCDNVFVPLSTRHLHCSNRCLEDVRNAKKRRQRGLVRK